MKKIIFLLSIIFVLLTFFVISNCVGINGNPTELIGTWKGETKEEVAAGDVTIELTITFNDDGTFTAEETTDDETAGTETEEKIKGNYYGAPSDTPKSITFDVTSYDVEVDGVDADFDEKDTYHGTYYLVYSSPYKLCLESNLFQDYTLEKQD